MWRPSCTFNDEVLTRQQRRDLTAMRTVCAQWWLRRQRPPWKSLNAHPVMLFNKQAEINRNCLEQKTASRVKPNRLSRSKEWRHDTIRKPASVCKVMLSRSPPAHKKVWVTDISCSLLQSERLMPEEITQQCQCVFMCYMWLKICRCLIWSDQWKHISSHHLSNAVWEKNLPTRCQINCPHMQPL